MNLQEAYSILELSSNASPEEAKKRYKELTKKLHPDINKEDGAEDKFKKINEAYQVVSTGKSTDREEISEEWDPFIRRHVSGFHVSREIHAEVINLSIAISFKESVLGCKKDIKYKRNIKCQTCNGAGIQTINNGCEQCGGRGQVIQQTRGMIMVQTCPKCHGKMITKPCTACDQKGLMDGETSVTVTIPGGIHNNNILRLNGMGNFAGQFGPMDQYTDVHLQIIVTPESGLSIEGLNVISILEISLLEALTGCKKKVNTIMGSKEITINPLSKNKDEVLISQLGVNKIGNQRVIINVEYPKDINKLINILDGEL